MAGIVMRGQPYHVVQRGNNHGDVLFLRPELSSRVAGVVFRRVIPGSGKEDPGRVAVSLVESGQQEPSLPDKSKNRPLRRMTGRKN